MKTSETAAATTDSDTVEVSATENVKPSNVTKKPETIPEAKMLMWEVHQRMPAWKASKLIEFYNNDQDDLAALGEATGILFESKEMMSEAVQCLERIRKESDGKKNDDSGVPKASGSHSSQLSQQDEDEMSDEERSDDREEKEESKGASKGAASETPDAAGDTDGTNKQDPKSSSKEPEDTDQLQDASASSSNPVPKKKTESVSESHEDWFNRVTKEGQEVLWHPRASAKCPTLLTGVKSSDLKSLDILGWEDKLET